MKSFIPWVGGKGKLLWLIHWLSPAGYDRFVDVFGGSGTVTLNHPIQPGCVEVYNDYNGDLVNLFRCVRERPLALVRELGFLPLHSRDDFRALVEFLEQKEPQEQYLEEELAIAEENFSPEDGETLKKLIHTRADALDVRRAAAYFKLIRCSFSGTGSAFGARPCNIRNAFPLIWECSRRLANVVIENRDFESIIRQYGQAGTFLYCDPPYYDAECYEVRFPKEDHVRLHDLLAKTPGYVMVSYNWCEPILRLYQDFWIFRTVRPNNMSQTAGSEYAEVVMTNYDPYQNSGHNWQISLFGGLAEEEERCRFELIHKPTDNTEKTEERNET